MYNIQCKVDLISCLFRAVPSGDTTEIECIAGVYNGPSTSDELLLYVQLRSCDHQVNVIKKNLL